MHRKVFEIISLLNSTLPVRYESYYSLALNFNFLFIEPPVFVFFILRS